MNNLKVGTALRLYEIASHACRPLEFPRAVATDPADELLRKFEADQRRRLAELLSDLRALADPQAPEVEGIRRYRKAAEAFRHLPFNEQKVRRICRANAVGAPSGRRFAQMIEGTWHVVEPEFSIWRERFERGEPPE